ncbi:MAG: hypothetical protein R6X02_34295 [Enhygromyxa sp.]
MPQRSDRLESVCPHCQRPATPAPGRLGGLPTRELLVAAAAMGLVVGLGVMSEGPVCEQLGDALAHERDAALLEYFDERCFAGHCESIELVSSAGCRARVRVLERRFDAYGGEIGLFRRDEGLEFSPVLDRWREREVLDDKQLLGAWGL